MLRPTAPRTRRRARHDARRHYDDKAAEVAQGFWNCPCVPMRERKECHCMLFLTEENDFSDGHGVSIGSE